MSWTVMSDRFAWPAGTILTDVDLAGCNIAAAVAGGHLAPVARRTKAEAPERAEEQ